MPKADELDFKTGEPVAPETGQSESTEEESEVEPEQEETETEKVVEPETVEETEDISALPDWAKAKLEKLENDKENYKKGMLKYKKFQLTKEEKKDELSEAEKVAEAKTMDVIGQVNEKSAISQFLVDNPDAKDKWDDIVSNYVPKNGKESKEAVLKDLDRAYFLTRYERGELDKKKKDSTLAELSTVSRTTSKKTPEGETLSKQALQLAERMRVDPKKLAQEDDSPYAEIKF